MRPDNENLRTDSQVKFSFRHPRSEDTGPAQASKEGSKQARGLGTVPFSPSPSTLSYNLLVIGVASSYAVRCLFRYLCVLTN